MEKPDGSAAVPARASRPSRINRSIVFIGGLLALSLFTLLPWNTYHSSEPPVSFQTSLSKPQLDFEKSVAAVLADTLNEFGRNYDIAEFKHASDHIHNIIRTYPTGAQSRSLKKRGFFSALGSLFPGGGGATAAGATGATGATAAGGGGGLLSGALSSAASSLLGGAAGGGGGGLLSGLATAIAPAANALGVGVGQGAVKGLDLKTKPNAAQPTYTGINAIAENLGEGVTSSLLGSVDTSALTSSIAPSGAAIGQAATSLGQGLGGGAASGLKLTQATQSLNPADNATGLNAVVGGLGFGLTSSFLGNFDTSSLTSGSGISSMLAQIPAPAGKGLGEGAAQGLGLSGTASPAIAARAAASGAVDVSGITESFTNSLAATFLGQVKTSGAVSSVNTASLLKQVAIAAGPLGTGLGLGGAQGLAKLTASNSASNTSVARIRRQAASDPTSIGGIAQTFSQNLASNFVGNIDTSNIAPQNLGGSLLKTIAQAAPGIGTGLGSGAAQGLNLSSSPASTTSPDQADVSSIAESFSSGLSSSFVTRQNIAALAKDLGSSGTLSNAQAMIVPAALGLGKGLGGGAAVALGNQQAVVLPNGSDVESIAQNFAQGLSQNFLANGTLQSLQKTLTSTATSGLSNIKIANVSEGLAIGLVDGLGSSLSIGQTVNNDAVTFNDTVDGAAVGFGRGLGSAAGGLAQELFKNATKGVTSTRKKRSIGTTELAVLDTGLSKRVDIQATIGNLTSNLNLTTVQNLLQTSIDDLTCVGVGGLLQVLTGLEDSGTLKFGNSKLTGLLPTGVLNITSGGNEFQFQSPELTISVNGLPQPKLTALLVAHIFLAILTLLILVPAALMLETGREIALLIGMPKRWVNVWKYSMILQGGSALLLFAVLGLGVAANGSANNFHTGHQILGFITVALGLISLMVNLQYNRLKIRQLDIADVYTKVRFALLGVLGGLIQVVVVTGFSDLDTITLCLTESIPLFVTIGLGSFLTQVLQMLFGVVSVQAAIKWWIKKASKEEGPISEAQKRASQEKQIEIIHVSSFED